MQRKLGLLTATVATAVLAISSIPAYAVTPSKVEGAFGVTTTQGEESKLKGPGVTPQELNLTKGSKASADSLTKVVKNTPKGLAPITRDLRVPVIITLKDTPSHTPSSRKAFQDEVLTQWASKYGFKLRASYTFTLNGIGGYVPVNKFDDLAKDPNIVYIARDRLNYLNDTSSRYYQQVQSDKTSQGTANIAGVGDGTGILAAVIDTGVDIHHPAFHLNGQSYTQSTNCGNVKMQPLPGYDCKIPFGYDFTSDSSTETPDQDHGTHVAGIIAGNSAPGDDDTWHGGKAYGMAPNAQILAMKVFPNLKPGEHESGASTIDIINAIETAVEKGADSINMSLGSEFGSTDPVDPEALAVSNARARGIIVNISSGNSGRRYKKNGCKDGAHYDCAEGILSHEIDEDNTIAPSYLDDAIVGSPSSSEDSFSVASMAQPELSDHSSESSLARGYTDPIYKRNPPSSFSSWGVTGQLTLKPQISGIGEEVYSTMIGGKFDYMSGTSMAAPNVTGATLLVKSAYLKKYPSMDNRQIIERVRTAIMNTAKPSVQPNGVPYSLRAQGAGLVQVKNAIDTPVIARVNGKGAAEVGQVALNATKTFTVTLQNDSQQAVTYNVPTVKQIKETVPSGGGKTTMVESSLTIAPGKATVVVNPGSTANVTFTVQAGADHGFIEGYVKFNPVTPTGIPTLSVPVIGFAGDWSDPSQAGPLFYNTTWDGALYGRVAGVASNRDANYKLIGGGSHVSGDVNIRPSFLLIRQAYALHFYVTDSKGKLVKDLGVHNYPSASKANPATAIPDEYVLHAFRGNITDPVTGKDIPAPDGTYHYITEVQMLPNLPGYRKSSEFTLSRNISAPAPAQGISIVNAKSLSANQVGISNQFYVHTNTGDAVKVLGQAPSGVKEVTYKVGTTSGTAYVNADGSFTIVAPVKAGSNIISVTAGSDTKTVTVNFVAGTPDFHYTSVDSSGHCSTTSITSVAVSGDKAKFCVMLPPGDKADLKITPFLYETSGSGLTPVTVKVYPGQKKLTTLAAINAVNVAHSLTLTGNDSNPIGPFSKLDNAVAYDKNHIYISGDEKGWASAVKENRDHFTITGELSQGTSDITTDATRSIVFVPKTNIVPTSKSYTATVQGNKFSVELPYYSTRLYSVGGHTINVMMNKSAPKVKVTGENGKPVMLYNGAVIAPRGKINYKFDVSDDSTMYSLESPDNTYVSVLNLLKYNPYEFSHSSWGGLLDTGKALHLIITDLTSGVGSDNSTAAPYLSGYKIPTTAGVVTDGNKPTVTFGYSANQKVGGNVDFTVNDEHLSKVSYRVLDGTTKVADGSYTAPVTIKPMDDLFNPNGNANIGQNQGFVTSKDQTVDVSKLARNHTYTVEVTAEDVLHNKTVESRPFLLSADPPTLTCSSTSTGLVLTPSELAKLNGNIDSLLSKFGCKSTVKGTAKGTVSIVGHPVLKEGSNTLQAVATNDGVSSAPTNLTVTIKIIPSLSCSKTTLSKVLTKNGMLHPDSSDIIKDAGCIFNPNDKNTTVDIAVDGGHYKVGSNKVTLTPVRNGVRGNAVTITVSVTAKPAPKVSFTSPTLIGGYLFIKDSTPVLFKGTIQDSKANAVVIQLTNGITTIDLTTPSAKEASSAAFSKSATLAPGVWTAVIKDSDGEVALKGKFEVNVDKAKPVINIGDITDGVNLGVVATDDTSIASLTATSKDKTVTLKGTTLASEAFNTVFTGKPVADKTSTLKANIDLSKLACGAYTVNATANDIVNNTSSASKKITIDRKLGILGPDDATVTLTPDEASSKNVAKIIAAKLRDIYKVVPGCEANAKTVLLFSPLPNKPGKFYATTLTGSDGQGTFKRMVNIVVNVSKDNKGNHGGKSNLGGHGNIPSGNHRLPESGVGGVLPATGAGLSLIIGGLIAFLLRKKNKRLA